MRTKKPTARATESKPEKVLLHMARTEDGWAGTAIRFDGEESYRFQSLGGLFAWLVNLRKRK
jgi:hypothetical protein